MRAIIVKEFRELVRDHRTLAMVVVMPIMLLIIFGYAANFTADNAATALIGGRVDAVKEHLPEFFAIHDDVTGTTVDDLLRSGEVDVVIDTDQTPPKAYIDGSALFAAQSTEVVVGRAGGMLTSEVMYNPDLKTSWVMVPAIVGLIMTLIGTIITSIGLVRERETGTLEQLAVMPIRASAVIIGKIVPYFVLAMFDIAVVTLLGKWLFGVPFVGDPWAFTLGAAIFLCVVLGFGVLASTVSATTGQAIQTAMFFMLPQILLSGMVFPLEAMPWGVRWLGYALPLTYFIQIAHGIMLRGATLADLWPNYVVLAGMAVLILTAAITRFRATLAPRTRNRTRNPEPSDAPKPKHAVA